MGQSSEKAVLVNKVWSIIRYQSKVTNCGNCAFSGKSWAGEDKFRGSCSLVKGLDFPIVKHGICKHHSDFGNNSTLFVKE